MSDPEGVAYRSLAGHFSGINNRVIIDKTGLTGAYDVRLQWERDPAPAAPAEASAPVTQAAPHAPSLFDAMEQQLGLRMQKTKAAVEVMVIDKIEKPSAN